MTRTWRDFILDRIAALGTNKSAVNKQAGLKENFIHDFYNKDSTPSIDNFARIADALGVSMTELYYGEDKIRFNIPIVGEAREGDMWSPLPQVHQHSVPVEFNRSELVSITIEDDSYHPRYDKGDCIIGVRQLGTNLDNLIGVECITQTTDGKYYVRFLQRGTKAGLYSLRGHSPRDKDIVDATLAWAAPIRVVLRSPD